MELRSSPLNSNRSHELLDTMDEKPSPDEMLDAYDALVRSEAMRLRLALDGAYQAGFRAGVTAIQAQIERQKKTNE
jgi:hypothetical protein